jgi:hypothetical protein
MGEQLPDYADPLKATLKKRLGDLFDRIAFVSIYYQDILQDNEAAVFNSTQQKSKIRWDRLRKFLLYGFGDAAGLETRKEATDSPYKQTQQAIARKLLEAWEQVGQDNQARVFILAHSLGCQVISNYIWDAQQNPKASCGIWENPQPKGLPPASLSFLRLKNLHRLYTTGCNIPIFVAAHAWDEIKPFKKPNAEFQWRNYYDPDDVLGWPLAPLSDDYAALVQDRVINANAGVIGYLLASWNPFSHEQYWDDSEVLDPLVEDLKAALR